MRGNPRPLPVRAPLGIDMHAEQIERALAPRRQAHQRLLHARTGVVIAVAIQIEAVLQVNARGRQRWQGIQRSLPAFQVAMTLFHLGVELRLQALCPLRQGSARQAADQGGQINHGRAINEAKLRHWNQGTTLEKPAASRRSRCSSRLSGFITFSMALRFWAISSSL
ncbi:hypothetical protein D3C80_891990 [compost metagenome]